MSGEGRSIEELIKADTFQNMSDIEILKVIAYTAQIAAQDAVFQAKMDIEHQKIKGEIAAFDKQADIANEALLSMLKPLQFKEVDNGEIA